MYKLLILPLSLLALPTYANNLMGCDRCSQSTMTEKVKSRANFLPPGVHTINVIDTQNSNFEQFKVTVYSNLGSKTPSRQPRIDIKAVKSPLKRQIEKSLIEAKRGIIISRCSPQDLIIVGWPLEMNNTQFRSQSRPAAFSLQT